MISPKARPDQIYPSLLYGFASQISQTGTSLRKVHKCVLSESSYREQLKRFLAGTYTEYQFQR